MERHDYIPANNGIGNCATCGSDFAWDGNHLGYGKEQPYEYD